MPESRTCLTDLDDRRRPHLHRSITNQSTKPHVPCLPITPLLTAACLSFATVLAAQADDRAFAQLTPTTHLGYASSSTTTASGSAIADNDYSAGPAAGADAATTVLLPQYPGGEATLSEVLRLNLDYPAVAQENGIEGTCVLRVRIDESGRASVQGVVQSLSHECDAAAIAAVEGLETFTPARLNGKASGRTVRIAVAFKL